MAAITTRDELITAIAEAIAEDGSQALQGWEVSVSSVKADAEVAVDVLESLGIDFEEFLSRQR